MMYDDRKIKDIYMCEYIEVMGELYPLQKWYNQLINKSISEIEVTDVLKMIRQNEFMEIAILKSIDFLVQNPFVGEMYEGELMEKFLNVNMDSLIEQIDKIKDVLADALIANENYDWLDEEDRMEFADRINGFLERVTR